MNPQSRRLGTILAVNLFLFLVTFVCPASAQIFLPDLSATTDAAHKVHVSLLPFQFGLIQVTATGQISLSSAGWQVGPDGNSAFGVNDPNYKYAVAGAANYPTDRGGDGINHFSFGGANYDVLDSNPDGTHFGFAGAQTTDTRDPGAIRLGAIVYTFKENPARNDWMALSPIGFGPFNPFYQINVPFGAKDIYFAVNGTTNLKYSSSFRIMAAVAVPEPQTSSCIVAAAAAGLLLLSISLHSRKQLTRL